MGLQADRPNHGALWFGMATSTHLRRLWSGFHNLVRDEDGPTAVEYAVMLALIVIVCLTAIQSIGTNARTQFQKVSTSLQGAS